MPQKPRAPLGADVAFKDDDANLSRQNPTSIFAFYAAFLAFIPGVGIFFGFFSFVASSYALMRSREMRGHPGSKKAYIALLVSTIALITQLISAAWLISIFNRPTI